MVTRDLSRIKILLYGLDADLQKTRGMLLAEAGYAIDTAEDWPSYRRYLDHDNNEYWLILLCHTIHDDEREKCEALAGDHKIRVYALTAAIAPQEFIRQISEFASA
jgi:hypothetical protein